MKRLMLIIILLLTIISVSACNGLKQENSYIVIENEALETTFSREEKGEYVYVLNISTKKYHLQSCEYAINMSSENRYETSSMHYIMDRNYQPCKICIGR